MGGGKLNLGTTRALKRVRTDRKGAEGQEQRRSGL